MKTRILICVLLPILLVTGGCWDRIEVNDIAFVMGVAFDRTEKGEIEATAQILLPQGGGGGEGAGGGDKKKYFVESATGKNLLEAEQRMQQKLSRRLFKGHRRVVVIGEKLARHGLKEMLDSLSRDPGSRLRTIILVSKGMEGRELMNLQYPLERVPAEAIREMENVGAAIEVTLRDFLNTASAEGIQPTMATIQSAPTGETKKEGKEQSGEKDKVLQLTSIAVFKDLKLVGYLEEEAMSGFLWVTGKFRRGIVSAKLPDEQGEVSIDIRNAASIITPEISDGQLRYRVEIRGEGIIRENNSNLDLTVQKNVDLVIEAAKKSILKDIDSAITKAQEDYQADVFGFGSALYQAQPQQWQAVKADWDKIFPEVEVAVAMKDLTIRRIGMTGPPLQLKETEVKKK